MDWDKLRLNVENDNCVAVVGAGASRSHIPAAKEMAAQLLSTEANPFLDATGRPISDSEKKTAEDLSEVAQYLAVKHRQGDYPKFIIARLVREKCENPQW